MKLQCKFAPGVTVEPVLSGEKIVGFTLIPDFPAAEATVPVIFAETHREIQLPLGGSPLDSGSFQLSGRTGQLRLRKTGKKVTAWADMTPEQQAAVMQQKEARKKRSTV